MGKNANDVLATERKERTEGSDEPPPPAGESFEPTNTFNDHYSPSLRSLRITKSAGGACGFHLTRSKWDPYPWVSAVDRAAAAERSGLKAGDCVLEVNGEDVLGLRIKDVAELVKAKAGSVTLLLWSSGREANCDPESLCCGPMPLSLQRLALVVQHVLSLLECPVCTNTIRPPALQCQNGHLLCLECRVRAVRCPVCRDRYTPRRALLAEQIYAAIASAYRVCGNAARLRQKLCGPSVQPPPDEGEARPRQQLHRHEAQNNRNDCDSSAAAGSPKKFFAKLLSKTRSTTERLSAASSSSKGFRGDASSAALPATRRSATTAAAAGRTTTKDPSEGLRRTMNAGGNAASGSSKENTSSSARSAASNFPHTADSDRSALVDERFAESVAPIFLLKRAPRRSRQHLSAECIPRGCSTCSFDDSSSSC